MANEEDTREEPKAVIAEFKVSMHCNACERSVAKTIAKMKGVEKFKTDMNRHIVEVTGTIDTQKVARKLKKKTGKRVEVLGKKNVGGDAKKDVADAWEVDSGNGSVAAAHEQNADAGPECGACCAEKEMLVLFSDENPNACCTM